MYETLYLPEVKQDWLDAKQWYFIQQTGLDIRFEASVKNTIDSIIQMPLIYAVKYKNVRIAHTKIFPYNIHFVVNEKEKQIIIIGIVHNRRKDAMKINRELNL